MMNGYFDNAATTYRKPEGMYDHMSNYMSSFGANVGRGSYESSIKSGLVVAETRKQLLHLLNAPERKEVVFCPSATIALNTIIFGTDLQDGDCVYISHFEHNAVLRPLYHLQETKNIQIKYLPMSDLDKYIFDLKKIEACLLKDKPKMVIASQVSNVLGIICPVAAIAKLAHNVGAHMVVDAAQSCGLIDCDLSYIDYYVFAGHKTLHGPTGIGGFICDKNSSLKPFVFGGTGLDSASIYMPKTIPERFEAGTLNLISIVGLNYSLKWISENLDKMRKSEKENLDILYETLSRHSFLRIISPYPYVSSIVSCMVSGFTSDEIGNILSERGISVRSGLHCSPKAHEYIGSAPEGLIRFSISALTTKEDFSALESVLSMVEEDIV